MKLLKIEDKAAHFYVDESTFKPIDKIGKDDLLRLVELTLMADNVSFDPYDELTLPNQAHQVIYKNVLAKLEGLRERRSEFTDGAARLFLADYEKYKSELAVP
jgi:hypothetical protein